MRDVFRLMPLLLALPVVACGGDDETADRTADEPVAEAPAAAGEARGVTVEGFSGPESVLHDTRADVYLVSNIDGSPAAKDGNGFIARVSPEGEILELRWIDGAAEGVTLHAPKGMGLLGDTLVVADIDAVRLFGRTTGEPLGTWPVDGATFLNDVAVASDGTIYVSDTGVRYTDAGSEDTGTGGIHAFAADGSRRAVETGDLSRINGLAAAGGELYGVTGTGRIFAIDEGTVSDLPELSGLGLDGIVVTDQGLLISDWDTETVYRMQLNGSVAVVARNIASPADIGLDRRRGRLLIPGLTTDNLLLAPLEE